MNELKNITLHHDLYDMVPINTTEADVLVALTGLEWLNDQVKDLERSVGCILSKQESAVAGYASFSVGVFEPIIQISMTFLDRIILAYGAFGARFFVRRMFVHELTHIKQMQRGDLVRESDSVLLWKGKPIKEVADIKGNLKSSLEEYFSSPHEIEAYNAEYDYVESSGSGMTREKFYYDLRYEAELARKGDPSDRDVERIIAYNRKIGEKLFSDDPFLKEFDAALKA